MASANHLRALHSERLMRYRFDTVGQARQHVHVREGRQLLFFPAPSLGIRDGEPVLLEVSFTTSEQTLIVRGEVHSLETGNLRGAWLELYGIRLFEGMQIACGFPRRAHRRLPSDTLVRAEQPGRPAPASMARLADVSAGGARIVSAGEGWSVGGAILITEMSGGPSLRGKVIRARGGEVAIHFQHSDATTRRNAIRLFEEAVQRWNAAGDTRHPAACGCSRGGALYEPLFPRAAHRRVKGL
jgi:hypothetical protein